MAESIGIKGKFSIVESKNDMVVTLATDEEHVAQFIMSQASAQIRMAFTMMRSKQGSLVMKISKILEVEPERFDTDDE
jgi:hypothetical protein